MIEVKKLSTYDPLDFHILTSIITSKIIKLNKIIDTYKLWEKPKFETYGEKKGYFASKRGIIKYRLKQFMKEDLVFIEKDNDGKSNIYILNKKKVKFLLKHKFIDKYRKSIWIQERDGTECIFSL